jgi:hypothetical protein
MKLVTGMALGVLGGIGIGAALVQGLHAQTTPPSIMFPKSTFQILKPMPMSTFQKRKNSSRGVGGSMWRAAGQAHPER